ncbi:MAG TPA: helix-turn-helix transcriptional regulator [Chloroflexota bacterium]
MPSGFGVILRQYRERAGLSQRAVARVSRINPATVSRMESDDRGPSGPDQVTALATALHLNDEEFDRLLASAGYWPRSVLRLGPLDETLLQVARVLTAEELDAPSRSRFREVVALLAAQWTPGKG